MQIEFDCYLDEKISLFIYLGKTVITNSHFFQNCLYIQKADICIKCNAQRRINLKMIRTNLQTSSSDLLGLFGLPFTYMEHKV